MGVAVACGIGGAFAAIVFRILIRFFTSLFFQGSDGVTAFLQESWLAEAGDPLELARSLPWCPAHARVGELLATSITVGSRRLGRCLRAVDLPRR